MKQIEIYIDILKRLVYHLSDKRVLDNSIFYIMKDESLNNCEILSNKNGEISNFLLHNTSISVSHTYMYIDKKYAKEENENIITNKHLDDNYYIIKSMNKERFDNYYKEMFRKYKLINILDV